MVAAFGRIKWVIMAINEAMASAISSWRKRKMVSMMRSTQLDDDALKVENP